MLDDLNERVQARLAEFEKYLGPTPGPSPSPQFDPLGYLVWHATKVTRPLVSSWRERWDRHKPLERWSGMAYVVRCNTCRHAKDDELCAERLSVLREIGVKP
ncbi:hypothetical protein [Fodinicola feengrottensis]|uniref:Uncharacterized protein n=1 Tax=Fodinicola feengrottensis TaxID=435914 RepID=A0ABN2IAN6_9ACTN|nr:hypothetical protein [Fodinicola feengrottensis]